jgi:hypothetical protein
MKKKDYWVSDDVRDSFLKELVKTIELESRWVESQKTELATSGFVGDLPDRIR